MVWFSDLARVSYKLDVVKENLSVRDLPVTNEKCEYRCILEYLESVVIETVVKQWWLLEVISVLEALSDVHVHYANASDWEENR